MPGIRFTTAQDRALFAALLALPVAKIAAAILFLQLRRLPDRDKLVQYLQGLS